MNAHAADDGQTPLLRVVLASLIGTTIEWYDFFIYGTSAALIFNRLFFPTFDPLTGTLLAFTTYAIGFVARPVGGIIFGHFGDRIGRKKLLMLSLVLMGTATTAIGFLPTYASIGALAPVALIGLRLIQGFAVGGEWGGAVLLIAEHSPRGRRGFWTSWPNFGIPTGNLLAAAALALMNASLTENEFLTWGWRVPFIASAVLVIVGWWIRQSVQDSPLFRRIAAGRRHSFPLLAVVRHHWRSVTIGIGVKMSTTAFYASTAFAITWLTEIHGQPRSLALGALLAGSAVQGLCILLFGALSDKLGRRPIFIGIGLAYALYMFVFFPLLSSGERFFIYLGIMVALAFDGALNGPQASFLAELYPTSLRYSGASLSYQVGSSMGGLTPIVAIALYQRYGSSIPVSIYIAAMLVVVAVAAYVSRETRGIELIPD